MSFATGADDWSPPTSPMNTPTTAPLSGISGQASGTPPILGEGPSATPVRTAKYWACVSQMELMITGIMARLAVIEDGLQIASVAAQKAPKPSSAPALASKAPSPSSKTPTTPTSRIPQRVASQLAAFAVGPAGNEGRQFVTIRGTDQQIGEALVVIGKCIAKHRVRALWKQKTGNSAPNVAALAPSPSDLNSTLSTP
ncbi:hypothetical protein C0995_007142 [Termitomyces sp. Mi166|nr:hypothetical protein C0995_007142 [Termitomyces sp. Mi166\